MVVMLRYTKNKNDELLKNLEKNLQVQSLQNYIPLYRRFFSLNATNWNSINLDNVHLHTLQSKDDILYFENTPLFFKFSPLLDPLKYLTGAYEDYNFKLPTLTTTPHPKLGSVNNSSYVDSFFSYLSKVGFVL